MLNLTQDELQAAIESKCRAHPTSEEGKALVAKLSSMVEDHSIQTGLRKHKRRQTAEKLKYATGAFLADLLRSSGDERPIGWVFKSLHAKSFNGAKVSLRTFQQLVDGLKGLLLLEHVPGHKVSDEREDTGRYASRYRATPGLLTFCAEYGVEPNAVSDHFEFEYDLPKHPLKLRARKLKSFFGSSEPVGKEMDFVRTGAVERLEATIHELNEFFAKQTLSGGKHEGYIRIYQNGDDPDFDWDKGGRFYSQPPYGNYQLMSAGERAQMTINGEAIAEIDIRASYLTIFSSLHGIQLDTEDPYELPGLAPGQRNAVKHWMVATFGNAKPIRRWPPRMLKDSPELKHHRVAEITQAALTKYPILKTWGQPLNEKLYSWADLMWMESTIMFTAMLDLARNHGIPSLSVHDSLIVPASQAGTARETLTKWFLFHRKVRPLLKTNLSPPKGTTDSKET